MAVESIDRERFPELLQEESGPVAVDLWMEDCPPCNMMEPKAETNGKLVIKSTGIVVNAPVLAWPKGRR